MDFYIHLAYPPVPVDEPADQPTNEHSTLVISIVVRTLLFWKYPPSNSPRQSLQGLKEDSKSYLQKFKNEFHWIMSDFFISKMFCKS